MSDNLQPTHLERRAIVYLRPRENARRALFLASCRSIHEMVGSDGKACGAAAARAPAV